MKNRNLLLVVVVVIVVGVIWWGRTKPASVEPMEVPPPATIGGNRDEHGCFQDRVGGVGCVQFLRFAPDGFRLDVCSAFNDHDANRAEYDRL